MTHAQAVGDLYGQRLKTIGRIVNAETAPRNNADAAVMTIATAESSVHNNTTIPARKRSIATSKRAGMEEMLRLRG